MPHNPYKARQAKKVLHQPGNLSQLLAMLWGALLEAQDVLQQAPEDNPELRLKACHCLSQTAGQYAKLLEVGEIEGRLVALEAALRGKVA